MEFDDKTFIYDFLLDFVNEEDKFTHWNRFTAEQLDALEALYNTHEDFTLEHCKCLSIEVTNVPAGKVLFFNLFFPDALSEIEAIISCFAECAMHINCCYLYICTNLDKNEYPAEPEIRVSMNNFRLACHNQMTLYYLNVDFPHMYVPSNINAYEFFEPVFYTLISKYLPNKPIIDPNTDVDEYTSTTLGKLITKLNQTQKYQIEFII